MSTASTWPSTPFTSAVIAVASVRAASYSARVIWAASRSRSWTSGWYCAVDRPAWFATASGPWIAAAVVKLCRQSGSSTSHELCPGRGETSKRGRPRRADLGGEVEVLRVRHHSEPRRSRRRQRIAGQGLERVSGVRNSPRQDADVVEALRQREDAIGRQRAVRRLEADHAAQRRRDAYRPGGVRADRQRNHPGRDRGTRARTGATRHPRRVVRIAARPDAVRRTGASVGELVAVAEPDDDRTGRPQPAHDVGVLRGRSRPSRRTRSGYGRPSTSTISLTSTGTPASAPGPVVARRGLPGTLGVQVHDGVQRGGLLRPPQRLLDQFDRIQLTRPDRLRRSLSRDFTAPSDHLDRGTAPRSTDLDRWHSVDLTASDPSGEESETGCHGSCYRPEP